MDAAGIPARIVAPWRRPSSVRRAALRFLVFAALGAAVFYAAAHGANAGRVAPIIAFLAALAAAFLCVGLVRPGLRKLLASARKALRGA
ncbi:hypothetical protein U91I_02086 [alpha proteobacterium U9-1i]|nr:hypothetical protein U91I_02086 [alpha proteobacterium U9-1i]